MIWFFVVLWALIYSALGHAQNTSPSLCSTCSADFGNVSLLGSEAGVTIGDRTGIGSNWTIYSDNGILRFYYGGDIFTLNNSGVLGTPKISLGNASAVGTGSVYQSLYASGTLTGVGSGPFAYFAVTDTATSEPDEFLDAMQVNHTFGGAGTGAGPRSGGVFIQTQIGATPGTNAQNKFYGALSGQMYAESNDGGTSGTPAGNYYGVTSLAQAQSGATFLNQIVGSEVDVSLQSGSSSAYKSVLTLINVNSDAEQGSVYDAMLGLLSDNTTTTGFNYGIAFGRPDSTWPITSTGTLIGSVAPGTGSRAAGYGVDWSGITFANFAFRSTGFAVDGSGNVTAASYKSGSSAGVSCPANTVNLTTLVVTNGIITHC